MEQPKWLDKQEFPFRSHSFPTPDGDLHYIDEGSGPVIVFFHGTPEWSFTYREVIKALRGGYRCIAVDLLGFGLSAKPEKADYSIPAHARRVTEWLLHLNVREATLIAGDFGGGIALDFALHHPDRVKRLLLWNTWCRSLVDDPHFGKPAKILHTGFARFLYRRLNFPVRYVMPRAWGDRKKLTRAIHAHYKAPLDNYAHRIATYAIGRELLNASPWWEARWQKMDELAQVPVLIFWGTLDKFIPLSELAKWKQRMPHAQVQEVKAGHWPVEESPEEFLTLFRPWMAK